MNSERMGVHRTLAQMNIQAAIDRRRWLRSMGFTTATCGLGQEFQIDSIG